MIRQPVLFFRHESLKQARELLSFHPYPNHRLIQFLHLPGGSDVCFKSKLQIFFSFVIAFMTFDRLPIEIKFVGLVYLRKP